MRDCNVSLQNLTIDGGWNKGEKFPITRSSAFINVLGLDAKLEVGANATIQNCKNQGQFDQDASGGAIYAIGGGTINFNGNITSCSAIGGAGGKGKDAYNLRINGYDGGNRENRYEDDNVEGDNEKNGAADYF